MCTLKWHRAADPFPAGWRPAVQRRTHHWTFYHHILIEWIGPVAEEWRPVVGWPYEVSSEGRVRRAARNGAHNTYAGRHLRATTDKDGYKIVTLCLDGETRTFKVHQLVCAAFVGPCPEDCDQVRHFDGNPANNVPGNLFWGTAQANAEDRKRHGRTPRGEKSYRAKLTNAQAKKLREDYAYHMAERDMIGFVRARRGFVKSLAKKYGLSIHGARTILAGRGYAG